MKFKVTIERRAGDQFREDAFLVTGIRLDKSVAFEVEKYNQVRRSLLDAIDGLLQKSIRDAGDTGAEQTVCLEAKLASRVNTWWEVTGEINVRVNLEN